MLGIDDISRTGVQALLERVAGKLREASDSQLVRLLSATGVIK
jgi:hypothetical protein